MAGGSWSQRWMRGGRGNEEEAKCKGKAAQPQGTNPGPAAKTIYMSSLHSPSSSDKSGGSKDAERFLDAFLLGAPADACLLFWELSNKRSCWLRLADREGIDRYAATRAEPGAGDTYVGVALSPKDFGPGRRCPADQAIGIIGVWVDVDIAGDAHKKGNLPQTIEQAQELAGALGVVPTFVVHSGHGLQYWWLFEKPWIFADADDRHRAQDLVRRFQAAIRANAEARGWSLDSTHDLARVMRLPGTWNHKGDPVQVRILEINPTARYSPSDLAALVSEEEPEPVSILRIDGRARQENAGSVIERARRYVEKMPAAISGSNGHDAAFGVAQTLVRGFALSIEQARPLLLEYSGRCTPPWSEREIEHKLQSANEQSRLPYGYIINRPRAANRERNAPPAPPTSGPIARGSACEPDTPGPNEADDDPHRLARVYDGRHQVSGVRSMYWWREEWHRWDGAAYRSLPDKEVKAELCQTVKEEFDRPNVEAVHSWLLAADSGAKVGPKPAARRVTTKLVGDVHQALAGGALLPSLVEPPCWLGDEPKPFAAGEVLACRNGLVHLPSFTEGGDYHRPPTPRFFATNSLGYDFLPTAPPASAWLGFLAALWPDDFESVAVLQEWIGYCLLPDTSQQKILMCVGPKRSGKGTIARVLTRLVGADNCCAPTMASLTMNFGLSPLLGKTLAVISDARLSGRTDTAVVVERLLSISGEDAQTVDRKHMRHVTARLPVRFVILTNELPRLNDPSGALVGRLLVLPMVRSWFGKEDTTLTDKLLGELPGILLWAIEGWRRLRERGRFVQPANGERLVEDLEDLTSPVGAFVRECCETGAGREVEVQNLFNRWKRWCDEKGRREHGTEQTFGRDLRAAVPGLDTARPRRGEDRVRVYSGIRLQVGEEWMPPLGP